MTAVIQVGMWVSPLPPRILRSYAHLVHSPAVTLRARSDRNSEQRLLSDTCSLSAEEVWAILEAQPGFNEGMARALAQLDSGQRIEFEPVVHRVTK
jgi:hypothetical protein